MASGKKPLSRSDNIVIQEFADEILIYDLEANKAYCLNKTSAMVWNECDGTRSVSEIGQTLRAKYKVPVNDDIVSLALSQFKRDKLLANSSEVVTSFDGLSRREVVKKVGFASVVALPVISALIAPTALSAQSVAGQCFPADASGSDSAPGCPCQGTFDCCGICSATGFCTGPPRAAIPGVDPGASAVCFGSLSCFPADNSGSNSVPGCPCVGTFDCCGICSATNVCTGPPRAATPVDPGAAASCP